jgi:hypothetical protein
MAAVIVDDEVESVEQVEPIEIEVAPAETSDELPDKYRGKSARELVEMHQETERMVGRQANEVGELRKAVDSLIEANLTKETPTEPEVDFFDDPDKAVEAKIANHPAIRAAQESAQRAEKQSTQAQLLKKHPDIGEVLQDPSFSEWVGKSSFRKQLFKEGQAYNFEAADELVTLYKERKGVVAQTAAVEGQQRSQSIRDASTGSTRGTGASTAKTYRRADIVKLMRDDPDRYEAIMPEIQQAYAEGRVR